MSEQHLKLEKGNILPLQEWLNMDAQLSVITFGLNWSPIYRKAFFGLFKMPEAVDLDGSVAVFDEDNNLIDQVYYGKLLSVDAAIKHSGDDLVGNPKKNEDNELIYIDVNKLSPKATKLVFFLNSYKGHNFNEIPFSRIRIFLGEKIARSPVSADYHIIADPSFKDKMSIVMGKMYKEGNDWKFLTIGEPVGTQGVPGTIKFIRSNFL